MASTSVRTSCPLQKTETEQLDSLFTERICASLSSSDLGSLDETSDNDKSRSRASNDSGGSLDRSTVKVEPLGSPDTDTTAEKDQFSVYPVPDCPELSPSISTATPLGLAWSFYSEVRRLIPSQHRPISATSLPLSNKAPLSTRTALLLGRHLIPRGFGVCQTIRSCDY